MAKSRKKKPEQVRQSAPERPEQEPVRESQPERPGADRSSGQGADSASRETGARDHNRIAERAHQLYVARGGGEGYDLDDWLAAERELSSDKPPQGE